MLAKKAQSGIELTIVVGIATMLLVPLSAMLYSYVDDSFSGIKEKQIGTIADSIKQYGGIIRSYGNKARILIEFNLPDSITNISSPFNNTIYIAYGANKSFFRHTGFDIFINLSKDDWSKGRKKYLMECTKNGSIVVLTRWYREQSS